MSVSECVYVNVNMGSSGALLPTSGSCLSGDSKLVSRRSLALLLVGPEVMGNLLNVA